MKQRRTMLPNIWLDVSTLVPGYELRAASTPLHVGIQVVTTTGSGAGTIQSRHLID